MGHFQIILKLLKSTVTSVDEPMWDLMMKNIYNTGAFQLEREDFKLNIFYKESSELNYITPVEGTPFPNPIGGSLPIQEQPLLSFFNFDRLNYNNDPQIGGDGFFDFVPERSSSGAFNVNTSPLISSRSRVIL